tara:strand:- start:601 stop:870 length:270 start_codon:yes stop_codon:yes gene_type:complete
MEGNMSFEIEDMGKSIPIPSRVRAGKSAPYGAITSAFSGMDVGQCIRFPNLGKKQSSSVRVQATNVGQRIRFKFTTRTIDGMLHVWRVA